MPEKILESVLNGELDPELLLSWLLGDDVEEAEEECLLRRCGRNEFTAYFLSYLRTETDSLVENDTSVRAVVGSGTPDRNEGRVHRRSASDPTTDTPARPHHSPNRSTDKKRSGRKVKTKLFSEERNKEPPSPDDGRITTGIDKLALATSTPLKSESVSSPRGDTTRSPALTPSESRSRHSRQDATFGDFLTTASKGKKKRNSRASDDSREDCSLEATPSAGGNSARKSSSLRSEKRRIKPTNIDLSKKSVSLNSFQAEFQKVGSLALENNEVFSAPPLLHGESFSGSPGFAAERDALRRERHRLLEKFSSLSAATSPKCTTPLIKISQEEDNFILPDVSKVTSENTIEVLVKVYQVLLDSNLALSYTNELCFLLALLRCRQRIDANVSIYTEPRSVLRSVHNAACLSARTLRTQRAVLATLLDRPSLRALAEARVIKAMAPDLAKSLLDVYGVRGEAQCPEGNTPRPSLVVAWNAETDGAENFPSALSFHCFKKQRDMFYEISRWYDETGGGCGVGGPSLRTRVRALLAAGAAGGQANYAHLGVLVARHALAAVTGGGTAPESRLSKLQRRLTRPPAHQASSLFTPEEEFYRELLSCTESEPFRVAVRDALITQLYALDAAPLHNALSTLPALCSLGKLLGLQCALAYCPQQRAAQRAPPIVRALRTRTVPALDVHGCVLSDARTGRLVVTLPWASAYLTVLAAFDPAALRLPVYAALLRLLRSLYRRYLPLLPFRTSLYLRCTLSALFAQTNIPQEILYEDETDEEGFIPTEVTGLDAADFITEAELGALLAARKDFATLLAGGGVGGAGPRHVTPLRVGPAPRRAEQRYTQIQKRLEEAVVRNCGGSGARRVIELVLERVSAAALSACTRALAAHAHQPPAVCDDSALRRLGARTRGHIQAALEALVPERGALPALHAVVERAARARLARHAKDTGELCDAFNAALRSLVGSSWGEDLPTATPTTPPTTAPPPTKPVDIAGALIDLKECICLTLERTPPPEAVLCATLDAVWAAGGAGAGGGAGEGGAKGVKRAALQLSVDLCVTLACYAPGSLTEPVLRSSERVWAVCSPRTPTPPTPPPLRPGGDVCEVGGDSRAPTPDSDDAGPPRPPPKIIIVAAPTVNDKVPEPDPEDVTDTFGRIISPRNVHLMTVGGSAHAWAAWLALVVRCCARGWLSAHALTESCVKLYRRDWPQEVLTPLSAWLRELADEMEKYAGGDAQLAMFVGFLGEYCGDLVVPTD